MVDKEEIKFKEISAEEQLKEMESIVEKKEKEKDEEISKEFDAKAKVEEGRSGDKEKGSGNRMRESFEEKIAREQKEKLERWVPKTD